METVKVDINKLQLLNDRITQVIEALNQVRMSAHGVQYTGWAHGPQLTAWSPWSIGASHTPPWAFAGGPIPWSASPFGAPYAPLGGSPPPYTVPQQSFGTGMWPNAYVPSYGVGLGPQYFGAPLFSQHPGTIGGGNNGSIDGDSQRLNRFV